MMPLLYMDILFNYNIFLEKYLTIANYAIIMIFIVRNCEFRNQLGCASMIKQKRYCLQKLVEYDPEIKMETWKIIKYCSNDLSALYPFITSDNYRVWDTVKNTVVKM